MLPDVPWFSPASFIHRHLAMIALRSSTSSFFTFFSLAIVFSFMPQRDGWLQASLAGAFAGRDLSAPAHVAAAALRRTRAGRGALVLVPEDDSALVEVVGAHLDSDTIALDRLDAVLLHLAGRVGNHLVAVVELHAKARIGEDFRHRALEFH